MDFHRTPAERASSTSMSTSTTSPQACLTYAHSSNSGNDWRSEFPSSRVTAPSFHSLQPSSTPSLTSEFLAQSNLGSRPSLLGHSYIDPSSSPGYQTTTKRDSGGSSSSGSGGALNTSQWRSTNNVYIKGLPERCTNDDLQIWAEQVATPVSVKTIRDARDHGICTGLGFVRFALPAQAKLFIALVNAVDGYEACFAKETYSGKMDKAADPRSANLYLSHIPLTYKEQDVLALFPSPRYIVRSLRLLHEGDQPGQRAPPGTPFKGAGFIRLDTREMAERAISELNGRRLPGHGRRPGRSQLTGGEPHSYYDTLQVRFADTEVQKQIKTTESELEKIHAMEMSGQLPPRSRKGQAYRRLSFSTEQKIKSTARKGRRGSGATTGIGTGFNRRTLPTPPSSFGSLGLPTSLPPALRGSSAFPSSIGSPFGLPSPKRTATPASATYAARPYAPPDSPVNDLHFSSTTPYLSDTPPSLGGFTSSTYSGTDSPASFGSISPVPLSSPTAFLSAVPDHKSPFDPLSPCGRGSGAFKPETGANRGLGLALGPSIHFPSNDTFFQSYDSSPCFSSRSSQGMLAVHAQHDKINRSLEKIDCMNGRRPSAIFSNPSAPFDEMNHMFAQTTLKNGYDEDEEVNEARATYDFSKLGFAPPSTPPPESPHPFFDSNDRSNRSSSTNHQRAHTTAALTAFPATPTSYDRDYCPSQLLAPPSALARRSSAVEERIARRKASQMSLTCSFSD